MSESRVARAVWLLALGQTLIYAGVYYAFPALLPDLTAGTGWSVAELALGPTVGFLVMALLTPFSGAWVDRGWGGEMLGFAPVVAALGLLALGFAGSPLVWVLIWAVIGVAQACCLYESCFSFLTRRLGLGARAAITKVTLVAGFSGTLAFPLGHWLGGVLGGQAALMAFAVLVLIGGGVNMLAVRDLRRLERAEDLRPEPDSGALGLAMRRPAFWALAVLFGLVWLNHGILLTYVLMLFEDRGASGGLATLAAASIGPAQVLGRLALLLQGARLSNAWATVLSLLAIFAASLALISAGVLPGLIFVFAAMQGAGAGLLSILRPVLVADILGRRGFGAVSGATSVAPILASAAAPSVGAALLQLGGPGVVLGSCLGLAVLALGLGFGLMRGSARGAGA